MNTPSLKPTHLHMPLALRLATLWLGLALSARASATVIDTYSDWDGSVTQSYLKVAQTFVAPADSTLASWQFSLAPNVSPTNVLFEIVRWDPGVGPTGSLLFTRQVNWPTAGGDVLVNNINLTLTPGTRYAAVMDLSGYRGPSVHFEYNQNSYSQGNAAWYGGFNPSWELLNTTYNTEFRAEFYTVPEPAHLFGLGLLALLAPAWRRLSR